MTEQTKDDSFLLCASDLSHAAIFDSYTELRACVNAVVKRITGLSQQKSIPADSDVIAGAHPAMGTSAFSAPVVPAAEIRFGGRCEKHLSPKPCEGCELHVDGPCNSALCPTPDTPAVAAAQPVVIVSLIEECRDALAEELAGWDLDPPLYHVKQAHDKCEAWLRNNAAARPVEVQPVAWVTQAGNLARAEKLQGELYGWTPLYASPHIAQPVEVQRARFPESIVREKARLHVQSGHSYRGDWCTNTELAMQVLELGFRSGFRSAEAAHGIKPTSEGGAGC